MTVLMIFNYLTVLPQVQLYTDLTAFDDRDLGTLFVRENGSSVNLLVNIIADPCPAVVWSFNGIHLGPSNATFTYNNACSEAGAMSLEYRWTFTLDVVLTAATSGQYTATFVNIAGTTPLPRIYFAIPGMIVPSCVIVLS